MPELRLVKLGAVVDFLTGFPFKSADYAKESSGIRLIRGDNIVQGKIRWDGVKRLPEHLANRSKQYWLFPGDVVLAMDRPWIEAGLKYAALTEDDSPSLLVQRVTRLRGTKYIDNGFLRYVIGGRQFTDYVLAVQTGTAVPHISGGQIKSFEFLLPAMAHQQLIASVLSALDNKIELNRRMNSTLEAMARAIFKDWFVDFGPTRAKMAGSRPYLAPEIWDLFPDSLDDEGKPQGWQLTHLERFVEINPIERLRSGTIAPYLEMAALPTSGPVTDPAVPRIFTSGMRFRNRDTLLARITPCLENGKTAYVQSLADEEVGWGSTEFIVFRARPPVPSAFTYLLARDPTFRAFAIQSMTGTSGRQRVNTEAISGYEIIDLPESLWRNLSTILEPLFNRIHTNGEESLNLVATRDLLLPKLMSGEISVKEAEKIAA